MDDLIMDSIGALLAGVLSLWALHDHARADATPEASYPRSPARRVPGSAAGKITMAPDFTDPLPDDLLNAWEGRER
jgi:hypothetical protein